MQSSTVSSCVIGESGSFSGHCRGIFSIFSIAAWPLLSAQSYIIGQAFGVTYAPLPQTIYDGKTLDKKQYPVLIIGAGPAGLSAAYELVTRGVEPLVLEGGNRVGGISRTEEYHGFRFDIGGHRFLTKDRAISQLWKQMLGPDFRRVPRLSRIYYKHKYYDYPLNLLNTLSNLGLGESLLILLSYLKARLRPKSEETTFQQWVSNRFGWRLYHTFFKTYTEKVWGIPCSQIQAEWAVQRIRDLSVTEVIGDALFGNSRAKSLVHEFDYPTLGPGMMWERFQQAIESGGGTVRLGAKVVGMKHTDSRITAAIVRINDREEQIAAEQFISSMPLAQLVQQLDPPAPPEVRRAAQGLKYRDLIVVGLIAHCTDSFPDNWIYVHNPDVQVGRIQNFARWSGAMVPDPGWTSLGMEYFSNEGDTLWSMSDQELIDLAKREIQLLDLAQGTDIVDGLVIRQPKAYPVYDPTYKANLATIQRYLSTFTNLQTVGRNGLHHYNNQDHSMITGILAARNLLGECHDVWSVNTDEAYLEEQVSEQTTLSRPVSALWATRPSMIVTWPIGHVGRATASEARRAQSTKAQ
ncbi:MAG: NAD(P)-binding protein [Chloroflexi bacterium]|nr:NAD(P)-binding protein [Chloroflexota bacterium]